MRKCFVILKFFVTLFIVTKPAESDRCVKYFSDTDKDNLVKTAKGHILGSRETQIDERQNKSVTWTSYFDIPFAEPPVGNLRFAPPVESSSWHCVRDARISEDKICPQIELNLNGGLHPKSNEDCLYLNVYVPETVTDQLLPVLVWIHGGGYMTGDGTSDRYGPLLYLSHDIIVVSVRYRLGSLGFLSLGTEDVPGNAGVRDQLMALKWIQENIMEFGGDPGLVTVNGQSAGSFATSYHLMSPIASGLFKRAILQSGAGGFSPSYHYFTRERAVKFGTEAAIELGCLRLSLDATIECMRDREVFSILSTTYFNELMAYPSIDAEHIDPPYLPDKPINIMSRGDYAKDLDIMIGFVEDESLIGTQIFLPAPDLFGVVKELWDIAGPYALLQKHTSEITPEDIELATTILNRYCGPLEDLSMEKFDNFTKMADDSFFLYGIYKLLDLHMKQSTGNTYYYRMKYYGENHNIWAPGIDTVPGVGHSDELYLQWTHKDMEEYHLNAEDSKVSLMMTTLWSNFVKFGNPTPDISQFGLTWDPVTQEEKKFLVIDSELMMDTMEEDFQSRMDFWDLLDLEITSE